MKKALIVVLAAMAGLAFWGATALCPSGRVAASPGSTVLLSPAAQNVRVGDTFTVDILIENAERLAAFEFRISFDPNILQYHGFVERGFLGSGGRAIACPPVADEAARTTTDAWFGCATQDISYGSPAQGSGTLATVTFKAIGPGTTPLTFRKIILADDFAADCCSPITYGEATVHVVGENTPVPTALPPTPTANPQVLTPIPQATPTRRPDALTWLTPQPGETPLARLLSDADEASSPQGAAQGGAATGGRTTSGGRGSGQSGAGAAGGSPRAGTGPPQHESAWWPTFAGGLLAAGGVILLFLAYSIHPKKTQGKQNG